jgi:hypothetical protein
VNETGMKKYWCDESAKQLINLPTAVVLNEPEPLIRVFIMESAKATNIFDCTDLSRWIRGIVQT